MIKYKLLLICCLLHWASYAQQDTLNQIDDGGKKQGYWIITSKMKPTAGYPIDGIIEEGVYIDNRKNGWWVKYHKDGKTPRVKGQYVNNRPYGQYVKFYESGDTLETGSFFGGKQKSINKRFFECGQLAYTKRFNENGREDGVSTYYFNNCDCPDSTSRMVKMQYTKLDGVTIDTLWEYFPSGCLKSYTVFDNSGTSASTIKLADTCSNRMYQINEDCFKPKFEPDPPYPPIKKNEFKRDGYNKVYNNNGELWMDGEFKAGRLWKGKLYKYDSDGILLKIEVWKEGKYHSDAPL